MGNSVHGKLRQLSSQLKNVKLHTRRVANKRFNMDVLRIVLERFQWNQNPGGILRQMSYQRFLLEQLIGKDQHRPNGRSVVRGYGYVDIHVVAVVAGGYADLKSCIRRNNPDVVWDALSQMRIIVGLNILVEFNVVFVVFELQKEFLFLRQEIVHFFVGNIMQIQEIHTWSSVSTN